MVLGLFLEKMISFLEKTNVLSLLSSSFLLVLVIALTLFYFLLVLVIAVMLFSFPLAQVIALKLFSFPLVLVIALTFLFAWNFDMQLFMQVSMHFLFLFYAYLVHFVIFIKLIS